MFQIDVYVINIDNYKHAVRIMRRAYSLRITHERMQCLIILIK